MQSSVDADRTAAEQKEFAVDPLTLSWSGYLAAWQAHHGGFQDDRALSAWTASYEAEEKRQTSGVGVRRWEAVAPPVIVRSGPAAPRASSSVSTKTNPHTAASYTPSGRLDLSSPATDSPRSA